MCTVKGRLSDDVASVVSCGKIMVKSRRFTVGLSVCLLAFFFSLVLPDCAIRSMINAMSNICRVLCMPAGSCNEAPCIHLVVFAIDLTEFSVIYIGSEELLA